MSKRPHPSDETVDQLRADLRRNHPELSDDQLDRLLTGEPARRRTPPRRVVGVRKRAGVEATSLGRTTSPVHRHPGSSDDDLWS